MMGCFLPCFAASKRPKPTHAPPSPHQTHAADGNLKSSQPAQQKILQQPINNTRSKIKLEVQPTKRGIKKITFDLSAKLSTKEGVKKLEESSTEPEKAGHDVVPHIDDGPDATADSLKDDKKGEDEEENEVNRKSLPAESSESLFSLSIDSRKQVSAAEKADYEVDSPIPLGGAISNTKEGPGLFGSNHDGVQGKPVQAEENFAQRKPIKAKDSADLFIVELEGSSKWNTKSKVNSDLKANTDEEPSAKEIIKRLNENKGDQEETPQISECYKFAASGKSSDVSRYRYQDCSDEECGDFDLNESDFGHGLVDDGADSEERGEGDGAVNRIWVQEESSESLFSLSSDSRKQASGAEKDENELNSPMAARGTESFLGRGGRFQNVSSVLNPIENLTQGRVEKATAMPPLKYEKENINSQKPNSSETSLKGYKSNGKAIHKKLNDKKQEEIGVDTSLSSWLVETETTPNSIGKMSWSSPVSHEDRPILGALTMEELKKFSVSSTPSRRSKSPSPDETPIIGTVGSYWSYIGQTTNS